MQRFGLLLLLAATTCFAADPRVRVSQTWAPFGGNAPATINGDGPSFRYFGTNNSSNAAIYLAGGAQSSQDGHIYTRLLCDDLTYTVQAMPPYFTHYYANVTNVEAASNNTTTSPVQVGVNWAFFDAHGADGGPGALLYREGYVGNFTMAGYYYFGVSWIAYVPPLFMLSPTKNPKIWGCFYFDNLGNPDVDIDYMNQLGAVINTSPLLAGSSEDLIFVSNHSAQLCPKGNPTGTFISHGENPAYNLNFEISQQIWADFDTLFIDNFDLGICSIPYF
jgi:hypothetical protein